MSAIDILVTYNGYDGRWSASAHPSGPEGPQLETTLWEIESPAPSLAIAVEEATDAIAQEYGYTIDLGEPTQNDPWFTHFTAHTEEAS